MFTLEIIVYEFRSDKGWFGKTAGCFNILRREMEHTRTSKVPTLHPVHVKEPLFKPSERYTIYIVVILISFYKVKLILIF